MQLLFSIFVFVLPGILAFIRVYLLLRNEEKDQFYSIIKKNVLNEIEQSFVYIALKIVCGFLPLVLSAIYLTSLVTMIPCFFGMISYQLGKVVDQLLVVQMQNPNVEQVKNIIIDKQTRLLSNQ